MATITETQIEQIIDASLLQNCITHQIATGRGVIELYDFTDTSVKVSFNSLTVEDIAYQGVMTLALIEGRWQSTLTIADDEVISQTGEIPTPASEEVISKIELTVCTAVSFWYAANPERIKLRELQITITEKDKLEELAIATITKLKKLVKSKPSSVVVIDAGIAECKENSDRINLVKDKSERSRELRSDLRGLIETLLEKNARE